MSEEKNYFAPEEFMAIAANPQSTSAQAAKDLAFL